MQIRIDHVPQSRVNGLDSASIPFSSIFSDHMLAGEYAQGTWKDPVGGSASHAFAEGIGQPALLTEFSGAGPVQMRTTRFWGPPLVPVSYR